AAATTLARTVEAWVGPGLLVFAGDTVELLAETPGDAATAVHAHARLRDAVKGFSGCDGRGVLYLIGNHDARLTWDEQARSRVAEALGAQMALAAELDVETGRGTRRVRVEPGHAFDRASAFVDQHDPLDSPLGHHVVRELLPAVRASERPWLAGAQDLADPVTLPSFFASRLAYRRIAPHLGWLALPFLAALLLKLPLTYALATHLGHQDGTVVWARRLLVVGLAIVADIVLVAGFLVVAARHTWRTVNEITLGGRGQVRNEAAEARARQLVAEGYAGLVTGHTRHPALTIMGDGFYANTGSCSDVVDSYGARFGLPPVFVSTRRIGWLELEAGADLHARLLVGHSPAEGASRLERLVGRSLPVSSEGPEVVAHYPQGPSWPPSVDVALGVRRVRRVAATIIALAGVLDLASAVTPPLAARLHDVLGLVPLAVPQAAAALVALAGVALLALARGIRRGQRHAWVTALGLLVGSAVLHIVKGGDVEEATVALAVSAYLVRHRRAFAAGVDRSSVWRGLQVMVMAALLAVATGTAAALLFTGGTHRLPWTRALVGVTERLVHDTSIMLPDRVGDFVTPALGLLGPALLIAAGWLVFRPVVSKRLHRPTAASDGARARDVVRRHGADTLAYFALRDDKHHFFWGDSVVSYAVYAGVCLVSPDPIGPASEREPVWAAFHRFADENGWSVAVLGATEEWLPVYRTSGMRELYVGDEAVVDCSRFELEGGHRKSLRQAVNRIAKYGYTAEFYDPAHLDPALQERLLAMMGESRRGQVERGFSMTLGRVFDPVDEGLLLVVAFGPDGAPVALCQYVPAPGIDGYSLDLMRRSHGEHPNGLLDFIVVQTIHHLRDRGMRGLCLNFATMRAVLAGETGTGLTQRVERWFLRRMSDSMQIESLWKYNAKFDPEWHPRYAVYDAPENVLPAALAVARAESFWELPLIGRFLVPEAPSSEASGAQEARSR
ncbi:MAG TPA: phosphatidylglycerol lysyltransferase domain-containing protein, partial [Acidimicrobiales bacterium]|nr:phosphatidylglycerol lysyltransferase domain-containing protein [Acidimicrobiales bacterium]